MFWKHLWYWQNSGLPPTKRLWLYNSIWLRWSWIHSLLESRRLNVSSINVSLWWDNEKYNGTREWEADVLPSMVLNRELIKNLVNGGNLIQLTFSLEIPQTSMRNSPAIIKHLLFQMYRNLKCSYSHSHHADCHVLCVNDRVFDPESSSFIPGKKGGPLNTLSLENTGYFLLCRNTPP